MHCLAGGILFWNTKKYIPNRKTAFTATTSESGNGGSNSRSQNKTTSGTKETNENNSAGDSGDGEKLYSGGTGTGTSGGNFFY